MSVVDTPTRAASRLHDRVRELRTRLAAYGRSEPLLMLLGAVIGVLTGLLAWVLVEAVFGAQDVAFGNDPGWARVVLVPAAGGLVVGLLAWLWSSEPSGGGIATVLRAVAVRGGRLRARVPAAVVAESGLALGTGSSGGREAPIILGGGAVGSLVGQLFSLNEDRMRTMVAAGAAAGIGASFNAPIGGMLFAIELILGQLRAGSLQVVVVASVAGSVTARELVGPELVFAPDTVYSLNDPRELAVYALLGVLAVGVGLAFHRGEQLGQALFRRVRIWPPLRVALGGLVVGGMALAVPEVLGSGHAGPPVGGVSEPILTMIEGGFGDGWDGVRIVAVLLVAKLVATLISVTTGSAVGTLLPTLFTGAALGAAVGKTLVILLPDAGIQPGAFALVGMAAVFAAAARTPLTAVLIVFELTGDYGLVLPLMLSAGLATFIADRIEPDGIYTAPLRREGIVTHEPDEVDVMQSITVGEVMTTSSPQLDASLPLEDVIRAFRKTAHHGFAVVDNGELVGVLTLSDVRRRAAEVDEGLLQARDIMTSDPLTVEPDAPMYRALHRMAGADVGRLPVVSRAEPTKLLGMLRRNDIVRAYQKALNEGLGSQQRKARSHLRDLVGVRFVEITVIDGSAMDGRQLASVRLPPRTILTSISRRGELVVPRGDTTITAGDEVVALCEPGNVDELRALLTEPAPESDHREQDAVTGSPTSSRADL